MKDRRNKVGRINKKEQSNKFWEEVTDYFPLIRHGPHRKRSLQQFFFTEGTCLMSRCLATIGGHTDKPTDSPLIRHGPHRKRVQQFFYLRFEVLTAVVVSLDGLHGVISQKMVLFNYSIVECVFVAAVTLLLSRCLATIRGYTYRHTD
jgi:hypothetical protein